LDRSASPPRHVSERRWPPNSQEVRVAVGNLYSPL
jgi:hypothetical protein